MLNRINLTIKYYWPYYSKFDTVFEQASKRGYRKQSNKGYTKVIERYKYHK